MNIKTNVVYIGIFFLILSKNIYAANFPSSESGRYKEHCEEKWTKLGKLDSEMAAYCVKKERKGYYQALEIIKKYENQKWIQDLINFQVQKWTKKGQREDSMVAFGLQKEVDGFEEISIASKRQGFNSSQYQKCSNQWGIEFSMVWFCYKN